MFPVDLVREGLSLHNDFQDVGKKRSKIYVNVLNVINCRYFSVEFYLCPSVSTALIHLIKRGLTR